MHQIWQTALAIIGSIGGAGVIVSAVVKFSSNQIADALSKKYELQPLIPVPTLPPVK